VQLAPMGLIMLAGRAHHLVLDEGRYQEVQGSLQKLTRMQQQHQQCDQLKPPAITAASPPHPPTPRHAPL